MSIKKAELFNGNKNFLSHRPWSAKQTKSIYVCHFFSLMLCLFRPNVIVEGGVDILCGRGIASFGVWQHGSFRYTGRSLLFQYSRQKSHYRVTSRIPFAQLFNNARLTKRQPLPKKPTTNIQTPTDCWTGPWPTITTMQATIPSVITYPHTQKQKIKIMFRMQGRSFPERLFSWGTCVTDFPWCVCLCVRIMSDD